LELYYTGPEEVREFIAAAPPGMTDTKRRMFQKITRALAKSVHSLELLHSYLYLVIKKSSGEKQDLFKGY
jgi:hypothetical protein